MQLVLNTEEYRDLVAAVNAPRMECGHEFVTKESEGCVIFMNIPNDEYTIYFKDK